MLLNFAAALNLDRLPKTLAVIFGVWFCGTVVGFGAAPTETPMSTVAQTKLADTPTFTFTPFVVPTNTPVLIPTNTPFPTETWTFTFTLVPTQPPTLPATATF